MELAVMLDEALGAAEALLQAEEREEADTVGEGLRVPLARPVALITAVSVGRSCVLLPTALATPVALAQPLVLREGRLLGEAEGLPLRVPAATVREAEVVVLRETLGVGEGERLRRALTLVEGV